MIILSVETERSLLYEKNNNMYLVRPSVLYGTVVPYFSRGKINQSYTTTSIPVQVR